MAIWFHNENIAFRISKKRLIKEWINSVINSYNRLPGTINYIFISQVRILEINKDFLNHNYTTDIISFDYSKGSITTGDIYISPEIVRENSYQYNSGFNEEMKRVMIHGILHFLGFNDKRPEQVKEMRNAENMALSLVKDLLII